MKDLIADNQTAWDSRVAPHLGSEFYDLETFRAGRCSLNPLELELLGDVSEKSLLHLQCHFGQDSISWARKGARVTGIDFSAPAITAAQALAQEIGFDVRFIRSDVLELDLQERFDIVFTSYGVLGWLPDLQAWSQVVARHLKPGGVFCLVEFHPVLLMYDFESGQLDYEYFHKGYSETVSGTYAEPNDPTPRQEHFWSHSIEGVLGPLLKAGLNLQEMRELDYSPYGCFPNMKEGPKGEWRYPCSVRLPHLYALRMATEETE